jgi:hypothetical protein
MNQEELSQVKQDLERLVADVKKLITTEDTACCTSGDGKIACHTHYDNHGKVLICLGLTAILAGIAGAFMAKKQSS